MNMLRSRVSGTRRRMTDGNYNIDLTYICQDRIIVMSYPAVNIMQQTYRNNALEVSSSGLTLLISAGQMILGPIPSLKVLGLQRKREAIRQLGFRRKSQCTRLGGPHCSSFSLAAQTRSGNVLVPLKRF